MAGINKAILIGRLGRDPEIRYTTEGRAIANFSIATSDEWKDKVTGEKKERTEWHRLVVYGKLAEICGKYLSKGRQVYIEGRIQTREWEDRDKNKRTTTEIVVDQMQMLGGRGSMDVGDSAADAHAGSDAPDPHGSGVDDNDVPF